MNLRTYLSFVLVFICFHLTHVCLSCVLLLNGWEPKSITYRAGQAHIVGVADVLRTFKGEEERSEDDTYTAEVKILSLYKGHDMMTKVDRMDITNNFYNVSNFGSKTKCFADVDKGVRYILFLTEFERSLSAQYHDVFGAAEVFTELAEREMLDYLGWNEWSEWTVSCSKTCGGGQQQRSRDCPHENASSCVGVSQEIRSCNLFKCEDSHDLLTLMHLPELPTGVTLLSDRDSIYDISKKAKLSLPVTDIFPLTFPSNFSILFKLKISRRRKRRYFFVVNDTQGKQKIAVFLGRKLKFQYLGNTYGFRSNLLDGQWHSVALGVYGSELVVIVDCDIVMRRRLLQQGEYLGTNLFMSVGPHYPQFGRAFEGELEQLVLSSNPDITSQQCGPTILKPNPTIQILTSSTPNSLTRKTSSSWIEVQPNEACQPACQNNAVCLSGNVCRCEANFSGSRCQIEGCSVLCENGGQCENGACVCGANFTGTRCETGLCTPHCLNGGVCVPPGTCKCPQGYYGPRCEDQCQVTCLNGGTCIGKDTCQCPEGYSGNTCENYECSQSCYNRGVCVGPDKCHCSTGYHGPQCQKVKCRPRCKNSGICVSPDVCVCKAGYSGRRCQKSSCAKGCKNGGTCGKSGKCSCSPFFYGRRCQKAKCRLNCLHGGRCKKEKCLCPPGFSGKRCERSSCKLEHYLVPFRRTYRKLIREKIPISCGQWAPDKTCTKTRLKYIRVTKDTYKGAYRCA